MPPSLPFSQSVAGQRLLLRFVLVGVAMYLVWFFGYEHWLAVDGRLDAALCNQITSASVAVLRAMGFHAAVDSTKANLVLMNGQPSVIMFGPCNGLVLYVLFMGFVLAFPGPWLRKLWFIPLGIALIWGLNVLRIAALAINHTYAYGSVDFNHHYTFTFVVYACIFGLWMLWARRLAVPGQPGNAEPSLTIRA
ncbi:exosortase X [Hymenobacter rubidus]|uniref:exosortase X n=1 Tax=Hymenobacter rubidus TaxID=1441626 RepID=UPI00191CD67B|nr:archaeosortase/exosortase family protein [Hymenobacter rubidus]